jgi:ribosomal protein S18 acetylase RimI-like enzyme
VSTDRPLVTPSDDQLAVAVEENLFALFRAMVSALPGGELIETGQVSRHATFPTNPMFKGAWRTRLAAEDVDRCVDETIAWFRRREAPYFFWWTGPGTEPRDLGERLSRRGLIGMEEQQRQLAHGIVQTGEGAPGMAADLSAVNEGALTQVPSGLVIEEIRDVQALDRFKRVFVKAYDIPEWAGQAWVDATVRAGLGRTPWRMYLGSLDGEPVATNMLFCGGGVASVYAVATAPAARGRGIGGAITLKPLLDARDLGYRHAVLFSTEMGVHAYERIGFRRIEARIDRYLWRTG